MWPLTGIPANPMVPAFEEMKRVAANIGSPGELGGYTLEMFQEDYPEFFTVSVGSCTGLKNYGPMLPAGIITMYLESTNRTIIPSRWGPDWRMAAGLFTAHQCAMRLQTYSDGSTPGQVAARAGNTGTVKSASMGDTSVSYDNSAVNSGTERWGTWNLTKYGSQLATMARMIGIAGTYAI